MSAPDLLGPRPRAPRRVLMPAIDAGLFPDGKDAAHFQCRRCGHDTGWVYALRSQVCRGIPCPTCNPGHPHQPRPETSHA